VVERCFGHLVRWCPAGARRIVPLRLSKYARPSYPPSSLPVALLLKEHLLLTDRWIEHLLLPSGRLRRELGFRRVPDHATLWWFSKRHLAPELLQRALAETDRRAVARPAASGPGVDRALAVASLELFRLAGQV